MISQDIDFKGTYLPCKGLAFVPVGTFVQNAKCVAGFLRKIKKEPNRYYDNCTELSPRHVYFGFVCFFKHK